MLLEGLLLALNWQTLAMVTLGIIVGMIFGALPGLTTTMAMAIFVPTTFFMPPLIGIPFLLGLYKGGVYGGSIPAILISTPGTGAAVATTADGYALTKQGKAGVALKLALYASALGEFASNLITIFLIGFIAKITLMFGVTEIFALLVFSFVLIGMLSGDIPLKGFIAAAAGLAFAMVGMVPMTGENRFTFGALELSEGFAFVPLLIGLFAMSEILYQAEKVGMDSTSSTLVDDITKSERKITRAMAKRCARPLFQGIGVGAIIGMIPALGQPVAALLNYGIAKETSKYPEEFGKGSIEGVVASEAANNATNGPTLIPLLSFGIPGDVITAVLLGAFIAQGLRPGPSLMRDFGPEVYGMLIAMCIGNVFLVVIGLALMPAFVRIVKLSKGVLYPIVLTLSVIGSFAIKNSIFDVWVMIAFGVVGYFMKKTQIPVAPFVIAVLLGSMTELNMMQALLKSGGRVWGLFQSPIALGLYIVTAATVTALVVKSARRRSHGRVEG